MTSSQRQWLHSSVFFFLFFIFYLLLYTNSYTNLLQLNTNTTWKQLITFLPQLTQTNGAYGTILHYLHYTIYRMVTIIIMTCFKT